MQGNMAKDAAGMVHWVDVSIPLWEGMTMWPGDPAFEFAPQRRIAQNAGANVSRVSLSTHTGTHVDAPWHFEEDGQRLDEVDTSLFFGEALVLELLQGQHIRAEHLPQTTLPRRVLFKTRNSDYPADTPFRSDYIALAADAAQRLVEDGVKLVGVDYLSVAPYKQPGQETHHRLLRNNVLIVEGLRLRNIPPGVCQFVVLPLPLQGADGAPCRAFVGLEA